MASSLDPDLGPKCLQRFSVYDVGGKGLSCK